MKVKTSELTGIALDYAVAKAQGGTDFGSDGITWGFKLKGRLKVLAKGWAFSMSYCPSTDWALGGPIIEREKLNIEAAKDITNGEHWLSDAEWASPTPLIAAMRCYVASKLGDEVVIPKELLV